MSPRLRSGQRGAIGLVFAGTLALALVFLLLVVDSGRLYLEKRKLQPLPTPPPWKPPTAAGSAPPAPPPSITPSRMPPGTASPLSPTTAAAHWR